MKLFRAKNIFHPTIYRQCYTRLKNIFKGKDLVRGTETNYLKDYNFPKKTFLTQYDPLESL
jgi:hypothetical protein